MSEATSPVSTDHLNAGLRRRGHWDGQRGEVGLASGPVPVGSPSVAFPPLPPQILVLWVEFLTGATGAEWVVEGACVWQLESARNDVSQTCPIS